MRGLRVAMAGACAAFSALLIVAGVANAQGEFVKTQLVDTTLNPMEIEVAPDGTVFYTERRGVVGVWDPDTESSREIGQVPVTTFQENGLMGIALDPNYESNGWIYLAYSALPLESLTQRVSRFQLDGSGNLDLTSEVPVFEWTHLRETCCHSAGALEFDGDGNLLISTGDNANPFESDGYTPIDERAGRASWDAQRTSANTNDHNGKLLRITPRETILPGTEPGIGDTYDIPAGNMFPQGTEDTLPEIYAMGFRNPFRFKVDEDTGWYLLADYGPDAGSANPNRGPDGRVEWNVITEPGNFGWPYCVDVGTPYIDFTFPSGPSGDPFDCDNLVNDSPNNTGLTNLPPNVPATIWQGRSSTDPRLPGFGTGGAPMAGPRYYYDPSNPSPTKFPEEFDGKWFIADWNVDWIRTVDLDSEGNATDFQSFPSLNYLSPMDMEFGPDGALYLAEWGVGFGENHPESGIYRIDHVQLTGPQVTASADPTRGPVPLEVDFDGEATDPEGDPNPNYEYEWDFGDGNSSTEEDPTHTYTEVGTYVATLTVTDPDTDEQGTDTVQIRVDPVSACPTGPRSDEFEGDELDASKWTVIRPDPEHPLSVSDGELHVPIVSGSLYGPGGNATNVIGTPLPDGQVSVTAKLRIDELTENYHQAGLRVYADDENWASVHMIHVDGNRDIEFIWESNGNPRNGPADKLGGIPSDSPYEFYVRLTSDGSQLTASYSFDGEDFDPVGQPGSLATFENPMIGPVGVSGGAPSVPMSHFDWVRFDPDDGAAATGINDEFDGTSLDLERWNAIVNYNPDTVEVADGQLTITTEPGDIYTGDTNPPPNNFILQSAGRAPEDWTIETTLSATIDGGFSQGGLMAMEDTDNYVKFDPISDQGQTRINRIELRSEVGAQIMDPQANVDVPAGIDTFGLRLTKEGTTYSGQYSLDGGPWQDFPEAVENPMEAPDFGVFAIGVQQGGDTVSFDYFRMDGTGDPCVCAGDEFDGESLDLARWNEIVRHDPDLYRLEDGVLWVETVEGDIYTDGDPAPTRNFFLQSPDHAGENWEIETKVYASEISGGFEQGGLMAYEDDDNYIKFDVLADQGQTSINRIELRSELNGAIQNPQPQLTPLPANDGEVWLRLTKDGTTYSGEYSFDGESWTALPQSVEHPMVAPRFGLFTLGVQMQGNEIGFEYFRVDGGDGCPQSNLPPVVEDVSADPTGGLAPLEVDFSVSASDPDGDQLSYSWDFGDGGSSNQQNPTHTYTEGGQFDARVTVSDGQAQRTSQAVRITVLPEDDPDARFRALVFSRTEGFRHDSIPAGHNAIMNLAQQHDFQTDHTEDPSLFTEEILSRYDTVVFLSTTGDVLNNAQQAAFENYIQSGGGFTGIHSASDTEYTWPWYGLLVGAYFRNHPPGTPSATVNVEDQEHPSTAGLPDSYTKVDEWYNFQSPINPVVGGSPTATPYNPRDTEGVHVLATVDESTYNPSGGGVHPDDHPVIWCQRYDGGRSWYTAMGHTIASFSEANFRQEILGGMETTAGVKVSETCGLPAGVDITPPITTHELDPASPGAGGTYGGPVDVTLSATDPEGEAPEPETHDINADGSDWQPDEVDAVVGDDLRWNFPSPGVSHDVWLAAPGTNPAPPEQGGDLFEVTNGPVGPGGPSVSYELDQAGTWTYVCRLHATFSGGSWNGMVGEADVQSAGASGVDYTEYRVNTNGATGNWVQSQNDGGEDPFETSFTVSGAGDHQVQYRSVDNAGNVESIKSVSFSISGDPSPCVERSDEFDTPPLDTERWSFFHPTTPTSGQGAPRVQDGSLVLPLGSGELDEANTGPIGLVGQPLLDGDFELVTQITGDIAADNTGSNGYAQAGLMLHQTDNNFIKITHTRVGIFQPGTEGQSFFEIGAETNGVIQRSNQINVQPNHPSTWWMRLVRTGNQLTAWYTLTDPEQGGTWSEIPLAGGMNLNTIMPPANGPIHIGAYGGLGSIEVAYEYFRFTPDEECPENQPPEITSISATPSSGPAPLAVDFAVEATDPDGDELSYSWDFGDGGSSNQQNPSHTYANPGTYEAEVTVSDGEAEVSDSVTVTVEESVGNPRLRVQGQPKVRKVGAKKKQAKFRMRVTNVGDAATGPLRLCVKAPKKRLALKGRKCLARPSLDPSQTTQRPVNLRVKPAARGKVTKVTLIARGPNVAPQRAVVRVRAR